MINFANNLESYFISSCKTYSYSVDMVTNLLFTLNLNISCWWRHILPSVSWQWRDWDYDNSFLSFSNESVYVHMLMHFDKCILKRLKYISNITVTWRHHYLIHQFNFEKIEIYQWYNSCMTSSLPHTSIVLDHRLFWVNKVLNWLSIGKMLSSTKNIEKNFKCTTTKR